MIITLCGSARFEEQFKHWNKELTLRGHMIYSLASFPSDNKDVKVWYNEEQKRVLDRVHLQKISASQAILVLNVDGYIGESTRNEILHAWDMGRAIFFIEDHKPYIFDGQEIIGWSASDIPVLVYMNPVKA